MLIKILFVFEKYVFTLSFIKMLSVLNNYIKNLAEYK